MRGRLFSSVKISLFVYASLHRVEIQEKTNQKN